MTAHTPDTLTWRQISDHLDHGLELEPEARERWLHDLAATEPRLASRLRELFAGHDELGTSFLESPAVDVMDLSGLPPQPMEGKRAGAYTIERLIGRGGMGEVWLASRHDGRFEGRVAIKFLDSATSQTQLAERFRHEGRLLARLTHPNIARLIDAGIVDGYRQYLALEYIDGEPIDRYCLSNSLSIDARVWLILDVDSAVAHAHTNLVIHRDLKPSNVLVTHDGVAKLLDFGIAKLLRPEQANDPALTRFEEVALTPEYAAPEQLMGDVPSTATDIYQLGLLLYVLLTDRHPFPSTGSRAERFKAALTGEVPPASVFAHGAARKALRGDLDAILSMALSKEPKDRYATAAALREDLVRYLNREPVNARRGAAVYKARRFVQRHWLPVIASTVAIVGLVIAVVMVSAERDRAFLMAKRSRAITDFMDTMITEAAASDAPVSVSDMVARSEQLVMADEGQDHETQAAVLLMIASYRDSIADHAKALQLIDRGLVLLKDSRDDDLRARLICGRAVVMVQIKPDDAALAKAMQGIDEAPPNSAGRAECLFDRALVGLYMDDEDAALRYTSEALAELRHAPLSSKMHEANFQAARAVALRLKGRNQEAFETYEQVLKTYSALGLARGEEAISARNNLAFAYEAAGMPRLALPIFEENVRIMASRGPQMVHPAYLFNRAHALEVLGRYTEARAAYQDAMDHLEAANHHDRVTYLFALGHVARLMGEIDDAIRFVAQGAQELGPSESSETYLSLRMAYEQGMNALAQGRLDDARAAFERASSRPRSKPMSVDVDLGKAALALAEGNGKAANERARAALALSTQLQGGVPWSYRTGLVWLTIGHALQKLGDTAQAHEAFVTAVNHLSTTVDERHPALLEARALSGDRASGSRASAGSTARR